MRENLGTLGILLRRILVVELPQLGDEWWREGVLNKLSYQQRLQATDQEWSSLEDLDVAATLRVFDQNWDLLRRRGLVKWDDRNLLKEASSIRNRYSHDAPGREPSPERLYRDIDTLALLAASLDPNSDETRSLSAARSEAVTKLAPASHSYPSRINPEAIQEVQSPSEFTPGAMVRVKARPEITGVITKVDVTGIEPRISAFHGHLTQTYYASQIELVEILSSERVSAEDFKARLTALHVLHPSVSRLYSLNSGRIDYEPYQYRPVMKLISADRPRLLIADDVGVGKTIEAGLIIKELQARQKLDSILVICPKPLVVESKWRSELKRFDEDFAHLDSATLRHCIDETRAEGRWPSRYRKAILPYSLLDEKLLLGDSNGRRPRPGLVSLLPPVKFDLVIVDEAHHVRNSETWSHRVVKHLLDSAEAAVLISATPIQTGNDDLRNLLRLLRPDIFTDNRIFDLMREPNQYLANVESAIRASQGDWQSASSRELDKALETAWGSRVLLSDPRTQELAEILSKEEVEDEERVRALRNSQALNTFSTLINRTRRRDIGVFTTRKSETFEVDFTSDQQNVYEVLLDLAGRIAKARGHGQSLNFLLSTLQRQAASCLNGLAPFIDDILQRKLDDQELSEADVDFEQVEFDDLGGFTDEIKDLAKLAALLTHDPKLDRLRAYVGEKQMLSNNKLLVFSTFRHTLAYLSDHLADMGIRVGMVHGGVPDEQRRDLRARFAKERLDPEAIDVLLSSEVGTEGLDYQFCDALVNYDLPWNPMRIEQRIGRIDRRGQLSETIAIKNLIVSGTVDAAIYERCLDRIGVFKRALGASEEILGDLTREIRKIADDLTLTAAERDERLRQLADNKIARVQEQEQLEERESALFGLPLKRLDDEGVEEASSPWLAAPQLARLVQRYLAAQGYERAEKLFDKSVAVFRPTRDVRANLRTDLERVSTENVSSWRRWLESSGDQGCQLTFDPRMASGAHVELLSPVHELVRLAAEYEKGFAADSQFVFQLSSEAIPEGIYPIALHAWTYMGVRDDFEVLVTAVEPETAASIQNRLAEVIDSSHSSVASLGELDDQHYSSWMEARGHHIDETRARVGTQVASLNATHSARVDLLEDQILGAMHDNIRRMRESELMSAEADFQVRRTKLEESIRRCDITTTLLCSGTIEVRNA